MDQEHIESLMNLWNSETEDKETWEWRNDLTPEETHLVESWDTMYADANALYLEWKRATVEKRESEWMRTLPKKLYDLVCKWAAEECDAHSCEADADEFGYCQTCGAIVPGSHADHKEHGW